LLKNQCVVDADVVYAIIGGDFNCQIGSRFMICLPCSCASASNIELSDLKRLADVFTYCSDNGLRTSWSDHFLCSQSVDSLIIDISLLALIINLCIFCLITCLEV